MYETVKTQRSKITALEAKLSVAEKSKEDLTSQQEELRETLNQLESLSTTYIDPYYAAVEADESSSGSIVFDESFS